MKTYHLNLLKRCINGLLLSLVFIMSSAFATSNSNVTASSALVGDNEVITLTNNTTAAVDVNQAVISFKTPQPVSSAWGEFSALDGAYPTINITHAEHTNNITLNFSGWSATHAFLPAKQSISLLYASGWDSEHRNNIDGAITVTLHSGPTPPPTKTATIDIAMPTTPQPSATTQDIYYQPVNKSQAAQTISVGWDQTKAIAHLIAGEQYDVWATKFAFNNYQNTPNYTATQPDITTAVDNKANKVSFVYTSQAQAQGVAVTTDITAPKVPSTGLAVTLNNANQQYQHTVAAGKQLFDKSVLPDTYTISAANYMGTDGNMYSATITAGAQQKISAPTTITINYKADTPPPTTGKKFVTYWAGWTGTQFDLSNLASSKINVLNLAFADYNNGKIDTTISGSIADIPAENTQMMPSYINWTSYAHKYPNTTIMLSLGGATFGHIWSQELTPSTVDTMAHAIADKLNTAYPVYSGNFAKASEKIGTVSIDGIDLDVENGDARLTDDMASNVIALIKAIKKLVPHKLITFAGFSVGADPDGACTSSGSVHCGEDRAILTATKDDVNWVNVMAYDAGEQFALKDYQTAMAHYAAIIGKDKTLLGLDKAPQWQVPQPETAEQLSAKSQWAYQQGYNGIMFWAIDAQGNGKPFDYLNTISKNIP